MNEDLLPDFDELESYIRNLEAVSVDLSMAKNSLDNYEALCIKEAMNNPMYFENGKPPTVTYCVSVIKVIGNTSEDNKALLELRNKISVLQSKQDFLKNKILLSRDKLDLYRTISANERNIHL